MNVELIDVMGSDLTVVNAARVSYNKRTDKLRQRDIRLIKYLARKGHWTPFAHPHLMFCIAANIAVARQLYRHQVGLAVNEMSRRYVDDAPEYNLPQEWRSKPGANQSKQGSGAPLHTQDIITEMVNDSINASDKTYKGLIRAGVAPEQARLVLPMSMVTEWYWTGSLMAFIRICKERLAPDTQAETQEVAQEIFRHLMAHFPYSVDAWNVSPEGE